LTREELAREVALRTGLSRREVQAVVESILEVVEERLCAGEAVYLRGFGCFESRPGGRRRARDPRGDGVIEIPPRVKPVFRPYDRLREAVHSALSPSTRVVFVCPSGTSPPPASVSVVGSFNGWDGEANPMQKLPDGSWIAEILIPSGQIVSYRFNVDGNWIPDPTRPPDRSGNSVRQV
jgi:DNA-binding protein HU-beta